MSLKLLSAHRLGKTGGLPPIAPAPPHGGAGSSAPDRLALWLGLSDPWCPGTPRPFRALLDTGFCGDYSTFLLDRATLWHTLGDRAPSAEAYFAARPLPRVGASDGYNLTLWGWPETGGPHASAPTTQPVLIVEDVTVFVPQVLPRPAIPPLVGFVGLREIDAVLEVNFRTQLCHLTVGS